MADLNNNELMEDIEGLLDIGSPISYPIPDDIEELLLRSPARPPPKLLSPIPSPKLVFPPSQDDGQEDIEEIQSLTTIMEMSCPGDSHGFNSITDIVPLVREKTGEPYAPNIRTLEELAASKDFYKDPSLNPAIQMQNLRIRSPSPPAAVPEGFGFLRRATRPSRVATPKNLSAATISVPTSSGIVHLQLPDRIPTGFNTPEPPPLKISTIPIIPTNPQYDTHKVPPPSSYNILTPGFKKPLPIKLPHLPTINPHSNPPTISRPPIKPTSTYTPTSAKHIHPIPRAKRPRAEFSAEEAQVNLIPPDVTPGMKKFAPDKFLRNPTLPFFPRGDGSGFRKDGPDNRRGKKIKRRDVKCIYCHQRHPIKECANKMHMTKAHIYTDPQGRPICFYCKKVGHKTEQCPLKWNRPT